MTSLPDERYHAEVVRLHAFFVDWFTAGGEHETAAPFEDALADSFTMVTPDGALRRRYEVIALVRSGRGRWAGDASAAIRIERFQVHGVVADAALATYVERQTVKGRTTRRLSSALLNASETAPGGITWLFVHESWVKTS